MSRSARYTARLIRYPDAPTAQNFPSWIQLAGWRSAITAAPVSACAPDNAPERGVFASVDGGTEDRLDAAAQGAADERHEAARHRPDHRGALGAANCDLEPLTGGGARRG